MSGGWNPIDAIRDAIRDATNWLEERVRDIRDDVKDFVDDIKDSIESIVDKIIEEYERVGKQIEDEVKKQLSDLEDGIKDLGRAIDDIVIQNAVSAVELYIETATNGLKNLHELTKDLNSAVLEGDLKAVEDSFRDAGKRFEDDTKESLKQLEDNVKEIGRDFDDAVHMALDPAVDAIQFVRDEVVRPAWNEARGALEDLAKTIEDEVIKPAIDNAISALDEVVGAVTPDEFERLYLKAKNSIEDAVDKIQETRDDIRESLRNIEDELKKAGKFIDDMKVEIIKMAAVIAVGFIPGAGPLVAIALQAALDEIAGNESIFDRILEGNITDIASVLAAVAQALPVVGPAIGISDKVIAIVQNAQTLLNITNQVLSRKDEIKSLIKGEFDNIEEILLKTAITFGSQELSKMLPQDISDVLLNEKFLYTVATGNSEEIQSQLLGGVIGKINGHFNGFEIPSEFVEKIVAGDAKEYLQEKLTGVLSDELSGALSAYLPSDLKDLLSSENIEKILKGDIDAVEESLKDKLSSSITGFIDKELPQVIKEIVGKEEIRALLDGDLEALEVSLEGYVKVQLNVYVEIINNEEIVKSVKEFKSEIENVIEEVKNLEDELKDKYEAIKDSYVDEFKQIRDDFKSQLESQINEVKNTVESQVNEVKNQINLVVDTAKNLSEEIQSQIKQTANQIESLAQQTVDNISDAYRQSLENVKNNLEQIKDGVESEYKQAISDITSQIDAIILEVKSGIKAAEDYAEFVKDEVNLTIDETKERFEQIGKNLALEFKNQVEKINQLQQKIVAEAKANFANFQEEIKRVEKNIIRNISSYRDLVITYQANIEVLLVEYSQVQVNQIKQSINEIKNVAEDSLTIYQAQIVNEIKDAVVKIENLSDRLSDEFFVTLKTIEEKVELIKDGAQSVVNQQLQVIEDSVLLAKNYYNQAKANIEYNAKILLAQVIEPELKKYLSEISKIFSQLQDSYEQKVALLQALKEQNLDKIEQIVEDLGIENAALVAKYLSLVENAYDLYSEISKKIELANKLTAETIDILSDEYKQLVDEIKEIDLQKQIDEFVQYYQEIIDADLEWLKDDINNFVNDVRSSIESVSNISDEILQNYNDKIAEFENYVKETKEEIKIAINKQISYVEDELSSSKKLAIDEMKNLEESIKNNGTKLFDEFESSINSVINEVNDYVVKNYEELLNDEFLENLIKATDFNIDETIKNVVDEINSELSSSKFEEINVQISNLKTEISQKITQIDNFKNDVEAKINSANSILVQLNRTTEIVSQSYYNLLGSYKSISQELATKLTDSAINLISDNVVDSYESFIDESRQNIIDIKLRIENSVKTSITNSVISGLSASLNRDYITSIISTKIDELTKAYFDQDIFVSQSISNSIVSQTANWFKTALNVISGNGNNTTINGTSKNDYVIDDRGNDNVKLGDGDDYAQTGIGNDTIYGGNGNDRIHGGDGNDLIHGEEGNDFLIGAPGNDKIYAGNGDDRIYAGDNDDLVYAGNGNDRIDGGTGNDVLYGEDGDDIIEGKDGNDIICAGDGDDTVDGSDADYFNGRLSFSRAITKSGGDWGIQKYISGDFNGDGRVDIAKIWNDGGQTSIDIYEQGADGRMEFRRAITKSGGDWGIQKYISGDFNGDGADDISKVWNDEGRTSIDIYKNTNDILNGDLGSDTISYNNSNGFVYVNLTLNKSIQHDILVDELYGFENIEGSRFDDKLVGDINVNKIQGGAGNDQINGGLGADILNGGLGSDSFNYSSLLDSTDSVIDLIQDFEIGIDRIDLSEINKEEENISFESLEITFENGQTIVRDKNSDFAVSLTGNINISESDFEF